MCFALFVCGWHHLFFFLFQDFLHFLFIHIRSWGRTRIMSTKFIFNYDSQKKLSFDSEFWGVHIQEWHHWHLIYSYFKHLTVHRRFADEIIHKLMRWHCASCYSSLTKMYCGACFCSSFFLIIAAILFHCYFIAAAEMMRSDLPSKEIKSKLRAGTENGSHFF